jgi:hypothetical protein
MPAGSEHTWAVRALRIGPTETRVYARNHAFAIGAQASLRDSDAHPSAIEHLLGALAGDLLRGFETEATRRQVAVHAVEANLQGRLDNVLVHLGVVGETGHAGLAQVTGTIHVSADAEMPALEEIWRATLDRSPLYQTIARCAAFEVRLRAAP